MMNIFNKRTVMSALMALSLVAGVLVPAAVPAQPVQALEVFQACPAGSTNAVCKSKGADSLFGANSIWVRIINTLLFVAGAIAVLVIIIGGIRYILSAGDQSAVTSAKNTILYAVIGVIIVVVAYGIVNFVVKSIT